MTREGVAQVAWAAQRRSAQRPAGEEPVAQAAQSCLGSA